MAKSTTANPLADVKRALIGLMLDEAMRAFTVSPSASGSLLLAPDDWDVDITQDRGGIHVTLIDRAADEKGVASDEWKHTVLNVSDDDSGPF